MGIVPVVLGSGGALLGWIAGAGVVIVGLLVSAWGPADRTAIARDLRLKGCQALRIRRRPFENGLLKSLKWTSESGPVDDYGSVYDVTYLAPDGRRAVATCMTGPRGVVFWTDEHPDPGFDATGQPRNLPTYGQNWRG